MPESTKTLTTPTVQTAVRDLRACLTPIYGHGETEAIIRLVFQYLKDWGAVDLIINENRPLSEYMQDKIADIRDRLLRYEPIQYITGLAYFYGLDFHVAPGVLIPRPETEELVDLIVSQNKRQDLRILDIGTGSGCIAVSLARTLAFADVTAIDCSSQAIDQARENAGMLHTHVRFLQEDIFGWEPESDSLDIVVSNPPYVADSERAGMDANVLQYEPPHAIFVPDEDPLRFYRRIGEVAMKGLIGGGRLYFEINPLFADQLKSLMGEQGYEKIEIHLDIHGKKRMLSCVKPQDRD